MISQIDIRRATRENAESIAEMHIKYISSGFMSKLGLRVVTMVYSAIIQSNLSYCFIAMTPDKLPVGFIAGTTEVSSLYKSIIRRHFFQFIFHLLPKFMTSQYFYKIIETIFYPKKKDTAHFPKAELLSIAVKEDYRRMQLGVQLLNHLTNELQLHKIPSFKVVVGESLTNACKFYEKAGGTLAGEVSIHRGSKSRVYVWNI